MKWRLNLFNDVYLKNINTWDYQWSFAKLAHYGLNVIPSVNLVQNIGFSEEATHTKVGTSVADHDLLAIGAPTEMIKDMRFDKAYLYRFAKVNTYWLLQCMLKELLTKLGVLSPK